MLKFGTELEMIIYAVSTDKYDEFERKMRKYGNVTGDCSLSHWGISTSERTKDDKLGIPPSPKFKVANSREIQCRVMATRKEFEAMLSDLLNDVDINDNGEKDIRVDFNKTTGTHIHFSNLSRRQRKTPEIQHFRNIKVYNKMIDKIKEEVKTQSVKEDFDRRFCPVARNENDLKHERTGINVSDGNGHGTIEFRLFNLHGTNKENVIPVFLEQFDSIISSVEAGYTEKISQMKAEMDKVRNDFKRFRNNKESVFS